MSTLDEISKLNKKKNATKKATAKKSVTATKKATPAKKTVTEPERLNMTLDEQEINAIRAAQSALLEQGFSDLSRTNIIRAAVNTMKFDDKFFNRYQEILDGDKRRKKK